MDEDDDDEGEFEPDLRKLVKMDSESESSDGSYEDIGEDDIVDS